MPRPYPPEFRARAIALVRAGKQAKQTAGELGIHPVTLSKWLRQDDIDTRAILVEVGRRKMVGGQEDMITDVALDLAAAGPVLTGSDRCGTCGCSSEAASSRPVVGQHVRGEPAGSIASSRPWQA
ncbi:transposase [Streptomyces sp. DH41]|uniref:transposase n=1 Tax=Streptomyces sp. DH41 TaxID=3040125 RepID=UPI003FA7D0E6